MQSQLEIALKIFAVAFAIGLDVFAVSIGIGISGIPWRSRFRLGFAFSAAEIVMQVIGVLVGAGAGKVVGEIATYTGFLILAVLGVVMTRESFTQSEEKAFSVNTGWGLVVASLSISLDSLGVGFSMPSLHLPIVPMLITVAFSTVIFTLCGLAFGSRLGERFEKGAERSAGLVLIGLAVMFTLQHIFGGR